MDWASFALKVRRGEKGSPSLSPHGLNPSARRLVGRPGDQPGHAGHISMARERRQAKLRISPNLIFNLLRICGKKDLTRLHNVC